MTTMAVIVRSLKIGKADYFNSTTSATIHNHGCLCRTRLRSPDACHSIYHMHKAGACSKRLISNKTA